MANKTRIAPLKIKAAEGGDGTFEGYASVFDVVDSYADVVMKGAFERTIAEHKERGTMPKLLWQHKHDEPIGVFTDMFEDEKGLYVKGSLLIDVDPLAARAYAHIKAGSLNGLSIGYAIKDAFYDEAEGVLRLKDLELWETSIVTFPANEAALIGDVKTTRDLERFIRATGSCSQKEAKQLASQFEAKAERDVLASLKNLSNILRA